jgi:hypothetical protein
MSIPATNPLDKPVLDLVTWDADGSGPGTPLLVACGRPFPVVPATQSTVETCNGVT